MAQCTALVSLFEAQSSIPCPKKKAGAHQKTQQVLEQGGPQKCGSEASACQLVKVLYLSPRGSQKIFFKVNLKVELTTAVRKRFLFLCFMVLFFRVSLAC